jgi:hypothetical protein
VAAKIRRTWEVSGGFGTLLIQHFHYPSAPEAARRSHELMMNEVLPLISDLEVEVPAAL